VAKVEKPVKMPKSKVLSPQSSGPARRIPTQARSRRRYEAILDAAAELFADAGFDASTMDAIATKAETSIGSLYQFFPDKLAIFRALASRNVARSRSVLDKLTGAGGAPLPWPELLDASIDAFAAVQTADPGFRALLRNLHLYGVYEEEDLAVHEEFIATVQQVMTSFVPELSPAKRELVATMLVQTVSSLLLAAARVEPSVGRAMVAETKTILRSYLQLYVQGDGTAR